MWWEAETLPLYLWLRIASEAKIVSTGQRHMGLRKQKWTAEEEATLWAGVVKYGPGKWKAIKKDIHFGPSLICRSNVDIKDKWRNLNVDPNGVGSKRKRSRDPEKNTRGDISRIEEKELVAVQTASSGMITPEEEKLPKLLAVEDAKEEAANVAAYEAEVKAEAARAAASGEIFQARRTNTKEATLAVLQAVEKAEAAVATAKTAAIEAEAAVAQAEAAKTAAAAAAEIERAQAARAVAAGAEAEAAQEARKAATLVEQFFSLL